MRCCAALITLDSRTSGARVGQGGRGGRAKRGRAEIPRTEAELLSYKNFGETSLQEIKDILVAKGLRLAMRREEVLAAAEAAEPEVTLPDIDVPGDAPEATEALAMPISDLDLSIRSAKAVATLNVQTVGDLAKVSESDLLKLKNFGSTSLSEIKAKLGKLGLSLRE